MKYRFLIIMLVFALFACTKKVVIGYNINNQSNEQITVKYVLYDQTMDTVIRQISNGLTVPLYMHKTNGTFEWYNERLDSVSVFNYFEISNGEVFIQKDFKDKANWEIQKTGSQSGNFIFTVTPDDFE